MMIQDGTVRDFEEGERVLHSSGPPDVIGGHGDAGGRRDGEDSQVIRAIGDKGRIVCRLVDHDLEGVQQVVLANLCNVDRGACRSLYPEGGLVQLQEVSDGLSEDL